MANIRIKGIASFPNLLEPRKATEESKPRYGVQILIPNTDVATLTVVNDAYAAAIKESFPKGLPKNARGAIQSGAEWNEAREQAGKEPTPGLEGYTIISAYSAEQNKPAVLNQFRQPASADQVFAGGEAWFVINFFGYKPPKSPSTGMTAGLNGVLFTGKVGALGRLDGKPTVDQMFGDIAEDELAPEVAATGEFSV